MDPVTKLPDPALQGMTHTSARRDGVTFPIDTATGTPAEVRLRATTNEGLLTAHAALTHRLHAVDARTWRSTNAHAIASADLRAQRDLVRAEIIRRMQP